MDQIRGLVSEWKRILNLEPWRITTITIDRFKERDADKNTVLSQST